jgi:hypothetical protein
MLGSAARLILGLGLVASVVHGHITGEFRPAPWLLGLVGFPGIMVVLQRWGSRRAPRRFERTGPAAHVANVALFLALYLTPDYAPALSVTSDAALLFYGASMLLAAVRGYAGCEVLAVSNWLLHRDDQVGCLLFAPVDYLEARALRAGPNRHDGWAGGPPATPRSAGPVAAVVASVGSTCLVSPSRKAPQVSLRRGKWPGRRVHL